MLVAAADARPPKADRSPTKAGAVKKAAKAKTRRKGRYVIKRVRGKGHVPKPLLGPRWTLIGTRTPQAPGATQRTEPTDPQYTAPPDTPTTTPGPALALGVVLCDDQCPPWRVTPSKLTFMAGTYSMQLQNFGEDPHDLVVVRESDDRVIANFDEVGPASNSTPGLALKQVNFTAAGTYLLFCSLPGGPDGISHRSSGMVKRVTVTSG
jgi:hypothetical protein